MGEIKKKVKKVTSGLLKDFPQKRKFGEDIFYLYKTTGNKDKALKIAKRERDRGYYIRITYNDFARAYFVWRG